MKIGIVCEGRTDFIAIKNYVGAALKKKNIAPIFVALQPTEDNTSGGGWANVITWLENHPPQQREVFFQQGLFANSKRAANLDALLLQLDTDILTDQGALNFLRKHKIIPVAALNVKEKAQRISEILEHFANMTSVGQEYLGHHVFAPISECSEAWCVAVDPHFQGAPEDISGEQLCNAFGAALARSANRPVKQNYSSINKRTLSREKYCKSTSHRTDLLNKCTLFVELVTKLEIRNKTIGLHS